MSPRKHEKTKFLFAEKTLTFDEAFPGIEDIRIVVVEDDIYNIEILSRIEKIQAKRVYSKNHFPEDLIINCSNRLCFNGGFSISPYIEEMMKKKTTEKSEIDACRGEEGSPKGKKIYRPCDHKLYFKITIKYSEEKTN